MKFDDLDQRMRVFETAHDYCVLPDIYMVVRLDGRGFTRLTKHSLSLDVPFDERFRDAMLATAEHLLQCGFRAEYAYVQSDEISLLLHQDDHTYGRKLRKIISVLAGEASASFARAMQTHACLDARVSQLPNSALVVDYFRWRQEDAHRNCLNAHCYWRLRAEGESANAASAFLERKSLADKNEFLFQRGINFNDLPGWQKRGSGLYWHQELKQGLNPKTGEQVSTTRRRLKRDMQLPIGDAYAAMLRDIVARASTPPRAADSLP